MKGEIALPACPNAPIHPMAPVRMLGGMSLEQVFMAMGYIGARKRPMKAAAMALPMREGTNQMMRSMLGWEVVIYELILEKGMSRRGTHAIERMP